MALEVEKNAAGFLGISMVQNTETGEVTLKK